MDSVEPASSAMMTAVGARPLKKLNWALTASALVLAVGVLLTLVWAGFWIWFLVTLVME